MEKAKKNEVIAQIKDMLDESTAVYFIDFAGMTVAQVDDLRSEFYKSDIRYKVVKNTLALRSIKESVKYSGFADELTEFIKGNTGIVFSGGDPISPAKILRKFSEKTQIPKFKVAVVDNMLYGSGKLAELASLLSKEEIIAGILSSLDSPVSGIVGAVNAVMRDLASVIEEAAKKKAA